MNSNAATPSLLEHLSPHRDSYITTLTTAMSILGRVSRLEKPRLFGQYWSDSWFLQLSRRSLCERSMVPTMEIFKENFAHCRVLQKEDRNIFHLWTLWVWQWVTVSIGIFWFHFWNLKSSWGLVTNHAKTPIDSRENIKIDLA